MLDKWGIIKDKTAVEAGYVNNPNDRGGPTRWGITQAKALEHRALWVKHNWDGNMQTLPQALAYEIYDIDFWSKLKLDDIYAVSPTLAERIFDFGINAGETSVAVPLQKCLNALNRQQQDYPDMVVDGDIGPTTIRRLQDYVAANSKRDPACIEKLTFLMFSYQNVHYVEISLNRERNETFTNGWIARTWRDFGLYAKWLVGK